MQKSARVAGWRCFQGDFLSVAFPGLKARLRKAFVAADSLGRTESRLRARRSVTKAAWAILCSAAADWNTDKNMSKLQTRKFLCLSG